MYEPKRYWENLISKPFKNNNSFSFQCDNNESEKVSAFPKTFIPHL